MSFYLRGLYKLALYLENFSWSTLSEMIITVVGLVVIIARPGRVVNNTRSLIIHLTLSKSSSSFQWWQVVAFFNLAVVVAVVVVNVVLLSVVCVQFYSPKRRQRSCSKFTGSPGS